MRHWLTADRADPEAFTTKVQEVCDLYRQAPALRDEGVHVVSTDEKTGMQALERAHPTLPMKPGLPERREFEYIRHGTLCLIANLEVATGRILAPSIGPTRTEEDFAVHIAATVALAPEAGWIFVADNLDTHKSESLVRFVAKLVGYEGELGKLYRRGILKSTATRSAFLSDLTHRVRFVYTPKHCSWLNQIELFFSVIARRVLRRGSFVSIEDLKERVLAFIRFYNERSARPYRWTYTGRPLAE